MTALPAFADVLDASARIAGHVVRTPLLCSEALDEALGARAFIKAENLQRFGAFKARGAINAMGALTPHARANGVLAFSSGNHAAAVAGAARIFGVHAVIVMPADAPTTKRRLAEHYGAEVIAYDRTREDREVIGARIAAERGLPIIKPFDDPHVIAGQGTVGLEIAETLAEASEALDVALVCASGGGLATGVAIGLQGAFPRVGVYAVEPEGHNDIARSLAAGAIVSNAPGVRSICDALLVERMGVITFALAQTRLAGALSVDDDAVRAAVKFAFQELKLVLEPSGAIALAAALSGRIDLRGKTVAIVASGGNVDAESFAAILKD